MFAAMRRAVERLSWGSVLVMMLLLLVDMAVDDLMVKCSVFG